jgi:hypothetical protein
MIKKNKIKWNKLVNIKKKKIKKQISLLFIFISQLFLNFKNCVLNIKSSKNKPFPQIMKKKMWKYLVNLLLKNDYNFYKILELFFIAKKLNMNKSLGKILSIFLTKRFLSNLWWKMILNLEIYTQSKHFLIEILILRAIKETGLKNFFFKEYLNFKLINFKTHSISFQSNNFIDYLKINHLLKIFTVICCNISQKFMQTFIISILNILGKGLWFNSHCTCSLEEVVYLIKSKLITFNFDTLFVFSVLSPQFPISRPYFVFSLIKELEIFYSIFLKNKNIDCIHKDNNFVIKRVSFFKIQKILPEHLLFHSMKNFYLYY